MRFPRLTPLTLTAALALLVSGSAAAQVCPGADSYEPNDDCATTPALTAGTYNNLTLTGQANVGGINLDHYQVTVPNNQQLTIDVLFATANGDIDVLLYEGLNCAALTSIGGSATDNETVVATNTTGSPVDYTVLVEPWGTTFDCNDYSLVVTLSNDPCTAPTPDAFEDNDDCVSAQVLPGSATGLNVQNGDEDYYVITTQPGFLTVIDVAFTHAAGDLDAELFDDLTCVNQVDISQSVSDDEAVSYLNASGSPIDIVLHVYGYGSGFGCNDYDLTVTSTFDPCNTLAEDGNEENDDCAVATLAPEGVISAQATFIGDPDWYQVDLGDGEMLTADLLFTHANGDLDLVLYEGCPGTEIGRSETVDDNEQILYTNTSGGPQTVYLEAFVWQGSLYACNSFDLSIALDGGVVGTPFCFGDGSIAPCPCLNESVVGAQEGCNSSLGYGAKLTTTGSASVAADDIAFVVSQGRPGEPSMLVQGASLIASPFKDGVICMGNPTERVEIVFLDAAGSGTSTSSIITEGAIPGPGVTRYYQQWFRDPGGVSPCGNGSNFSAGLVVTYEP